MARRTKYNKEMHDNIVAYLEQGKGRVNTCKLVGIDYTTFLDWLDNKPQFSEAVKKAEQVKDVKIKETCESVIMNAATSKEKPTWQAAAWMLERKFPEEYRNKQEHEHSGGLTLTISKDDADL